MSLENSKWILRYGYKLSSMEKTALLSNTELSHYPQPSYLET